MVPRAALRVIVDPRPQIIASSERSGHFLEARPAGLEPPTYGFEGQILTGAPECTNGAVSDDRGKLRGKAAVSVQRAIDLLDTGDLDGARNVLADLLGSL